MPTRAQPPPARLPQMLFGMEVFLKSIIHDWDDEAATILGNCRRAMGPRGTLLLVERVMPARSGLTLTRVVPTATGFSVIEGRPARSG